MAHETTDFRGTCPSALRHVLAFVGRGMICVAAFGTACTYFARGPWYLEGAAYWIPAYLFLGIVGALACLSVRAYRSACLGLATVCAVIGLIAPVYGTSPNSGATGATPNLRILQANVYEHYGNEAGLINLIRKTHPDVVVLQEADEEWERRLRPLESEFPRKAFFPRFTKGKPDLGQYWLAKSDAPQALASQGIPGVLTTLHVNGRAVSILNVHLSSPFSPVRAKHHREQMHALAKFVKKFPAPLIVAGDVNSGPWSPLCRAFQRDTGLVSVRQGIGILGTWPSFLGPLRIGIDQMLVSPGVQVIQSRVGRGIGSDHRPLITDLYIPSTADTARASKR